MVKNIIAFFFLCYFQVSLAVKDNSVLVADQAHDEISKNLFLFSNTIDSFFGSTRADDQANGSNMRVSQTTTMNKDKELSYSGDVRLNLRFPFMEEKLQMKYDSTKDKNGKSKKKLKKKASTNNSTESGLNEWALYMDTGVKVDFPVQFFARARFRNNYHLTGKWFFLPTQEFFWYHLDGLGQQTNLNIQRILSEKFIFRFYNEFRWTELSDELKFNHGPSLFHTINDKKGLAYNLRVKAEEKPIITNNEYVANVVYRQLLYKKWFFYELKPQVNFPRSKNFAPDPSLSLKFEAVFGSF